MKLSVIVPVYNASPYLHRCVDSLLAQGLLEGEYEIILINDGSKDDSLEICRDYERQHPTIILVLTHENHGVAFTRNRGIKTAKGDYLCFVDADDYLIPGGYRYLIDSYLEESLDILSFWALTLDKKMKENFVEDFNVEGKIICETVGREFLKNDKQAFIWNSFYKRIFLQEKQLDFENLSIGEDVLFNVGVYLKNPRLRVVSSRIYRYELHEDSILRRRDNDHLRRAINSYIYQIDKLYEYILDNKDECELSKGLQSILDMQIVPFVSRILSSNYSINEFKKLKEKYLKLGIIPINRGEAVFHYVNFLFRFPSLIGFNQFLYRKLFIPYIYPSINQN